MRKLLIIAFVALLASCSKDGVKLNVENKSSGELTDVCCYTVLEGDTLMSVPALAVDEKTSVTLEPAEGGAQTYSVIFEYVREDGTKDNTVGSLSLAEGKTNATINVSVTDDGTDVDYVVED